MAKIYEFGTAPQAKIAGYDTLVETVISTDKLLLKNHANEDVIYVRGPAIYGRPAFFEFARFENGKSEDAVRALHLSYMKRRVPTVIYPNLKSQGFIVAPVERPTWWLGGFHNLEAAKSFCQNNFLAFTEHDACPVPVKVVEIETELQNNTRIKTTDRTGKVQETTVGEFVSENGLPRLDFNDPKCIFCSDSDAALFKLQIKEEGRAIMPGFDIDLF